MLSYIVTFVLGFLLYKILPDLAFRFHTFLKMNFINKPNPPYVAFKGKLLGNIKNIKSSFPEHQKTNSVRLLEIGVGMGANFQYYPDGTHLVVVDPNPHWKNYYNENRAKFPQIKSQENIVAYGENMDMVEDQSVDVVVITKVLCSVESPEKILKQVLRVLVPGGKFYFIEHIREWDATNHRYRQILQNLLTTFKVWPVLFNGCELNRDTLKVIEAAGFSSVDSWTDHAPIPHPIFMISSPHLLGVATK